MREATRVEVGAGCNRRILQSGNYNEEMIVVRYATLVALVLWLGAC